MPFILYRAVIYVPYEWFFLISNLYMAHMWQAMDISIHDNIIN